MDSSVYFSNIGFLIFGLAGNQVGVDSLPGHQVIVSAGLHDCALVHDDYFVRASNCAQPVGDDEGGPPFFQLFECDENQIPAIKDGYCDKEQADFIACAKMSGIAD